MKRLAFAYNARKREAPIKNSLLSTVLLALLFWVSNVFAQDEKTMSQYWQESGIKIEDVNYENFVCYSSEKSFRSCVAGIDHLAYFHEPSLRVIPQLLLNDADIDQDGIFKKIGGLVLVRRLSDEKPEKKLNVLLQRKRVETKKLREAELALFHQIALSNMAGTNPYLTDFKALSKELIKNIQANPKQKEHLAMIAGENENARIAIFDAHGGISPGGYIEDRNKKADESFFGIGVRFHIVDGRPKVLLLIDGGPAKSSKLIKKNDIILQVDGLDTKDWPMQKFIEKVRGKEGDKVKLLLQRGTEEKAVEVARGKIEVKNVEVKILNDIPHQAVGYIKLRTFNDSFSCEKINRAIEYLHSTKVKALILDLRQNPGGLMDEGTCIAGLFVGDKEVVGVKKLISGVDIEAMPVQYSKALGLDGESAAVQKTDLPITVLIDDGSASASEIVAGALQDLKRAWIVGETSFGKATVQSMGKALRGNQSLYTSRTIERFYQPSGSTNQGVGIQPDITVPFKPDATDEERAAFRELDAYPTALPPIGKVWKQTRAEEVKKIEDCVAKKKLAEKKYIEIRTKDEDLADYQVLVAQEILSCQ